jgi:hypothetical protein
MVTMLRILLLFLLSISIGGCTLRPGATVMQSLPEPVEIQVVSSIGQMRLNPEDERFATAVAELPAVLNSIHTQARTFFSPERFAEEIEPISYIHLRYAEDVEFVGQGVRWQASELAIAAPNNEMMLLARASDTEDWSVYLPDDSTALQNFVALLIQQQ